MPFEVQFIIGLQNVILSTPWMIALAIFFARYCIFADILPALALLSSKDVRERHAVTEAAWAGLLALALTSLISHVVMRARPFLDHSTITLLIPPPFNTSFPSGHTATAVALALAFFYGNRTFGLLALVIAGFVAFGRLATGVHYPTDIFGGLCVGVVAFGIVRLFHHQLERRDIERSANAHHHT